MQGNEDAADQVNHHVRMMSQYMSHQEEQPLSTVREEGSLEVLMSEIDQQIRSRSEGYRL